MFSDDDWEASLDEIRSACTAVERFERIVALQQRDQTYERRLQLIDILRDLTSSASEENDDALKVSANVALARQLVDIEQHVVALDILEPLSSTDIIERLDDAYRNLYIELIAIAALNVGRYSTVEDLAAKNQLRSNWNGRAVVAVSNVLEAAGRRDDALMILRSAESVESDPYNRAGISHHLGILYDNRGHSAEALRWFRASVEIARQIREPEAREVLSRTLASYSSSLLSLGKLDEAAVYADEALFIATEINSTVDYVNAAQSRANVCLQSGQPALAVQHYESALLELGRSKSGRFSADTEGLLLCNISICYTRLGHSELAFSYIMWAWHVTKERRSKASYRLAVANLAGLMSPEPAYALYYRAFLHYSEHGDRQGQALSLFGCGEAQRNLGNLMQAEELLKNSLAIARAVDDEVLICEVECAMGELCRDSGDSDRAWSYFKRAWTRAESRRRLSFVEPVQLELNSYVQHAQILAARIAWAEIDSSSDAAMWRKRLAEAVDQGRSRVFLDQIQIRKAVLPELPLEVQARLSAAANEVRSHSDLLSAQALDNNLDAVSVAELQAKLRRSKRTFEETFAAAAQSSPLLHAIDTSIASPDARPLDRYADSTAVIEFAVIDDGVVAIRRRGSDVDVVGLGDAEVLRMLDRNLADLCENHGPEPETQRLSREMYEKVMHPLEALGWLYGVTDVIVIPSPELFGFPVHAYLGRDGYLFEKYTFSYLPSSSSMNALGDYRGSIESAILVGDPQGDLPYAREELGEIADTLGPSVIRTVFFGSSATTENFVAASRNCDLVHLANHTIFEADAELLSWIEMAPSASGEPSNIDVQKAANLRLSQSLVVLSGCQSGVGSADQASEMIGFVRSFILSGACGVVASRWSVREAATTELVLQFYSALAGQDLHPADALRHAMSIQKDRNHYTHPADWGGFCYFGLPNARY